MQTFKHRFTPFRLGHVTLRNRIVSTPHTTHFGAGGYVTARYIRYDEEKAKGDAMAPRRMHDAILEGTRAARRI